MSTQSGNRETEYTEAFAQFRYFHDYRSRIFNFLVVFNGIALTVVINLEISAGQIALGTFAACASVIMLLAEIRAIAIADCYRESILMLEEELGFTLMRNNREYLSKHGWQMKFYFRAFYAAIIVSWVLFFGYLLS